LSLPIFDTHVLNPLNAHVQYGAFFGIIRFLVALRFTEAFFLRFSGSFFLVAFRFTGAFFLVAFRFTDAFFLVAFRFAGGIFSRLCGRKYFEMENQ